MAASSAPAEWYGSLVRPRSIAVVGASADPRKGGVLRHLLRLGYGGRVVPVNPGGGTIEGLPVATDVRELEFGPDLAIIVVPATAVPAAVRSCAEVGTQVAYVLSAGFAELGAAGRELEEEATLAARASGMRLLGPNSNGMIAVRSATVASIMTTMDDLSLPLRDDRIALISQSGAVGSFVLTECQAAGLGIGTYFSTGNGADVTFEELFDQLVLDDDVDVILAYVEGLGDGRAFAASARRAHEREKPIVVLKVGTTDEGAAASASHTASLAGSDRVYTGVLRQCGVRRVSSIHELVDVARLLQAGAPAPGRRLGVVTISGGLAVMAADAAVPRGVSLPSWDRHTEQAFASVLPRYASIRNPLDTSGVMADDRATLATILRAAAADTATDSILLALGGSSERRARIVAELAVLAPELGKATALAWVGDRGAQGATTAPLPAFDSVESAVAAISSASAPRWPVRPVATGQDGSPVPALVRQLVDEARSNGDTVLDEFTSKRILRQFGVPCVKEKSVASLAEAAAALSDLGRPVVAKVQSRSLVHKSDVGGVRLGLREDADVLDAVADLLELGRSLGDPDTRVVIQDQVAVGAELIVGLSTDPTFGVVITVGFGGVDAEVDPDVWSGLPFIGSDDADAIVGTLRRRVLLDGFRGSKPASVEQLRQAVTGVAALAQALAGEVSELDVNPLVVDRNSGAVAAVDAVMILK